MRKPARAILTVILISLWGCSGGTEPDPGDGSNGDGPASTASIDDQGGTASLGSFTVEVPAGAFEERRLSISPWT